MSHVSWAPSTTREFRRSQKFWGVESHYKEECNCELRGPKLLGHLLHLHVMASRDQENVVGIGKVICSWAKSGKIKDDPALPPSLVFTGSLGLLCSFLCSTPDSSHPKLLSLEVVEFTVALES